MSSVVSTVESAALIGFSFASAIAWMDVARWLIARVIMVSKNSGSYVFLTALFTTLLAILVGSVFRMLKKKQQQA